MSRKRVTESHVLWWEERFGRDHPQAIRTRAQWERQQARTKLRREELLAAVPQWYETPESAYRIAEEAWGEHPGVGYGSGTARAMLLRLAKDGAVEAVPPDERYRDYKFRFVNDGTVPQPPPPPPREPESLFAGSVVYDVSVVGKRRTIRSSGTASPSTESRRRSEGQRAVA